MRHTLKLHAGTGGERTGHATVSQHAEQCQLIGN